MSSPRRANSGGRIRTYDLQGMNLASYWLLYSASKKNPGRPGYSQPIGTEKEKPAQGGFGGCWPMGSGEGSANEIKLLLRIKNV